ncbi:hypothetical protein [Metallosphaera hakonensis]|uniref:Uncharacterized protein n=1 Tax=Metallosphaera hakonensis JCM 8857 = DSM 7519 TaxID=1293036 RepID=A0A2U9IRC3_9CREN|nr:hypothetical protein [Metallosphaera hakonensis]AWR98599.1 hypothetical protein DFR87_01540 [Metallosphaera hakonensis JCM 8857 = DSM 7519]
MNEETVIKFLDLDVDDRMTKTNLELALSKHSNLKFRIAHINYVVDRFHLLTATQQLRALDYLIYVAQKIDTEPYKLYNKLKVKGDDSVIYSITLVSIYFWDLVLSIDYFNPRKYNLLYRIFRKLGHKLPGIDPIERFLKMEIEEVGFNNAHLELLLLLDFIARLRTKGYSADLKATYMGLIIDSNAPPDIQREIKVEMIEDYERLYKTDIRSFVEPIYGMIMSLKDFESYTHKILG